MPPTESEHEPRNVEAGPLVLGRLTREFADTRSSVAVVRCLLDEIDRSVPVQCGMGALGLVEQLDDELVRLGRCLLDAAATLRGQRER